MTGEEFTYSGKKVTDPGFTEVMKWQAIPPEEAIPQVTSLDKSELSYHSQTSSIPFEFLTVIPRTIKHNVLSKSSL